MGRPSLPNWKGEKQCDGVKVPDYGNRLARDNSLGSARSLLGCLEVTKPGHERGVTQYGRARPRFF